MAQTLYKMRKVSQIQRFEGVEAWQEGFSSKVSAAWSRLSAAAAALVLPQCQLLAGVGMSLNRDP